MEIRVYTPDLTTVGIIGVAETVRFTRKLTRYGDFAVTLHPTVPYAEKLAAGNLLTFDGPNLCGIILHTEDAIQQDGRRMLTVSGRTPEYLLSTRLVVPPAEAAPGYEGWDRVRGPVETVLKYYVTTHCVDAANAARNIPGLTVAEDLQRGPTLPWQARYEPLDEVLEGICGYSQLGYKVTLDLPSRTLVFDVVEGRDMTADSATHRAVYDPAMGNLTARGYTVSHMDYANVGYAAGEGRDEDRLIQQIGTAEGWMRREVYIDCGSANIDDLIDEGTAKLAAMAPQVSMDADVIVRRTEQGVTYAPEPGLGDFVTVRDQTVGLRLDTQITEVTDSWEHGKHTVSAVFGSTAPTIMDKVRAAAGAARK
jgi:hypothetical protein